MGHKHNLIASKASIDKVDCMSKVVLVRDFCLKKFPENIKFSRGIIDPLTEDAVCEFSESVKVSLLCDKRDAHLCKKKKKGCQILKKIFAVNLDLTNSSLIDNILRCYYSYSDFSLNL